MRTPRRIAVFVTVLCCMGATSSCRFSAAGLEQTGCRSNADCPEPDETCVKEPDAGLGVCTAAGCDPGGGINACGAGGLATTDIWGGGGGGGGGGAILIEAASVVVNGNLTANGGGGGGGDAHWPSGTSSATAGQDGRFDDQAASGGAAGGSSNYEDSGGGSGSAGGSPNGSGALAAGDCTGGGGGGGGRIRINTIGGTGTSYGGSSIVSPNAASGLFSEGPLTTP